MTTHYRVIVNHYEVKQTCTLMQAIKLSCALVGANHIKTKRELVYLSWWFWVWHAHLTIKSGSNVAEVEKIKSVGV